MSNKLNKNKSKSLLFLLFPILLIIFWYTQSINKDYSNLKIDNVIYVDKDSSYITAYSGKDTLRIYYFSKDNHQLTFKAIDTFKIIKNRETEQGLILYKESIIIDTSKFLFYNNKMKIIETNYHIKPKYDRYVYRRGCQSMVDDNQLMIEDFLEKENYLMNDFDGYSKQEYSNIRYKYYELAHKGHTDRYYVFTYDDLDLFITKELCGLRDIEKKYSEDLELYKFNCNDCYCFSYYDTSKYDILFSS